MTAFRILSLDGGGIMGAFTASVLATYEKECKQRTGKGLVDHFDLITGTSTGGIIAIGLAMGASAETILKFYSDSGAKIFPRTSGVGGWLKRFRDLFRPKYTPAELRKAIEAVVGSSPLRDARTRLVIPSYDTEMGRIYLFKTPHHPWCAQDGDTLAVDVALATSAAPTYFPAHPIPGRGTFIDGGIWGNCPATVGITEALSFCGQSLPDVHVLSISTTNYPFRIGEDQQLGGLIGWAPKIIETFMFAQAQASVGLATCLLRDRSQPKPVDRFRRLDYLAPKDTYTMDDTRLVGKLVEVGRSVAEMVANRTIVMNEFLDGQAAPHFQGY